MIQTTLLRPLDSVWRAQPKQHQFLTAKVHEGFYGGAAGGGKSDALLAFSILRRKKYPGSKGLIIRRTIAELQKEGSLIPRSHELLGLPEWKWHEQKKKWSDRNGGVIEFGYCERESDVYKYQSSAYDDISFDELTHFTEFQYRYMKSRARSIRGVPVTIRSASNPGNVGHLWVKNRFVDIAPPGQIYTEMVMNPVTKKLEPQTRIYIPAKVWDNKALLEKDPNYLLFLQSLPPAQRQALLEGDWNVFEGQYFGEFRYDLHVCEPFPIPPDWPRYLTMDWGMAKPAAILWIAISPEGRAYVYRELYVAGEIASSVARKMLRFIEADEEKGAKYYAWWADPSIFARKGEGPGSIAEIMKKVLKRSFMPAKNQRVNGWMKVHEWFALAPDGKPWLQFFSTCLNCIRTIPALIHDETYPEDVDTDGEDHCGDGIRYFAIMRPKKPERKTIKDISQLPMRDQARIEREERASKERKISEGVKSFLDSLS